jgi:hypothetical protein
LRAEIEKAADILFEERLGEAQESFVDIMWGNRCHKAIAVSRGHGKASLQMA